MSDPEFLLVEPTETLRGAYLDFIEELAVAGEPFHQEYRDLVLKDFARFLRNRRYLSAGAELPEGYMPQTDYWMAGGGRIVATSRLRRRLTPALEIEGGHLGFDVRPSERGKGYASRIMALTLEKARQAGLRRVLLTCDEDNAASARVILKNGGHLDSIGRSPTTGKAVQRFWVDL